MNDEAGSRALNVARLHTGPSLMDIPNQLRALAERLEFGEEPLPEACVLVLGFRDGLPRTHGWGKVPTQYAAMELLSSALTVMGMARRYANHD